MNEGVDEEEGKREIESESWRGRKENEEKREREREGNTLLDKEKRQPCAYALRISSMGRLPIRIRCRGRALSLSGCVASLPLFVHASPSLPSSLFPSSRSCPFSLSLSLSLSFILAIALCFPLFLHPLLPFSSFTFSSLLQVLRFDEEVGSSKKRGKR